MMTMMKMMTMVTMVTIMTIMMIIMMMVMIMIHGYKDDDDNHESYGYDETVKVWTGFFWDLLSVLFLFQIMLSLKIALRLIDFKP